METTEQKKELRTLTEREEQILNDVKLTSEQRERVKMLWRLHPEEKEEEKNSQPKWVKVLEIVAQSFIYAFLALLLLQYFDVDVKNGFVGILYTVSLVVYWIYMIVIAVVAVVEFWGCIQAEKCMVRDMLVGNYETITPSLLKAMKKHSEVRIIFACISFIVPTVLFLVSGHYFLFSLHLFTNLSFLYLGIRMRKNVRIFIESITNKNPLIRFATAMASSL
ncbi:MAG: hypothetical protein LBD11_06015 [Candidatus Peribacteria bacterium]|jgi:hypothetical protein|nr:hypothetical protein [Candidatus Peribacteria bacterium]